MTLHLRAIFHNANYVQRTEAHKDNGLVVDVSTLYGSDIVSDHSCDVNGSQESSFTVDPVLSFRDP